MAASFSLNQHVTLGWAFVERQKNLWKRHWAWEVVWLVYGVVNTLAITFIAKQLSNEGVVSGDAANDVLRGINGAAPSHRQRAEH